MPFSKYKILKTFAESETIKLSIEGKAIEAKFIRVSGCLLTLLNKEGEEEIIHLDKITSITL